METRHVGRSIVILAGAVLSWFYGGSAILAANVDPGLPGPFAVATQEYDFGDQAFTPPGFPAPVEVVAVVHYPNDLSDGPFPLIIFMHGRHATCFEGTAAFLQWPCPAPQ